MAEIKNLELENKHKEEIKKLQGKILQDLIIAKEKEIKLAEKKVCGIFLNYRMNVLREIEKFQT